MKKQLIECVPNFSEGRDMDIIRQITDEIESVEGVRLLDVDPGKATNRTVVTFVGEPAPVVEAAYRAIKKAAELIDMSRHKGEHPRMGATDVCPFIPIADITMEETAQWAHRLAKRVGNDLDIPVYMYESAATSPQRRNLATVRAGEYEGLPKKLRDADWQPDYGPARFNPQAGATAIGARDFLVAYNVNLNTTSVRRANSVAFDVREKGRIKRTGDPITGKVVTDKNGNPVREPGACKAVKGIGWYIEEYGIAQVSMNLTNINITPVHVAFEECRKSAQRRGLRVTGSEVVGLVPLKVMLDAGRYFLKKQNWSRGASEEELIHIAVKSMGMDELSAFDPRKKIIEYRLRDEASAPLVHMNLRAFANETARDTPAPGGGSIAAYTGALGASLGTMVANLSAGKRGWDDRVDEFSAWAEKGQYLKDQLLRLVDEDTNAFNRIMAAFRLPKTTPREKTARSKAIQDATRYAIEIPLQTMQIAMEIFDLTEAMVRTGNPNSVTDAGVGALCARAAVHGAWMNVKINVKDLKDHKLASSFLKKANAIAQQADIREEKIRAMVEKRII
ncbi:MAG TPA: glutamate formimidoyltransferase [Bacteroidetes bacterium]|nr:glutamate formimidoyltransferase [Bacteroidota bacterium]